MFFLCWCCFSDRTIVHHTSILRCFSSIVFWSTTGLRVDGVLLLLCQWKASPHSLFYVSAFITMWFGQLIASSLSAAIRSLCRPPSDRIWYSMGTISLYVTLPNPTFALIRGCKLQGPTCVNLHHRGPWPMQTRLKWRWSSHLFLWHSGAILGHRTCDLEVSGSIRR